MPVWIVVLGAVAIGVAWFWARTTPTVSGPTRRASGRGADHPGGGVGMFGGFKPPSTYAPTAGYGRPAAPSAHAMRDADRMRGEMNMEEKRNLDLQRDQELAAERAYHLEQQRIDDDYVNSGGYY